MYELSEPERAAKYTPPRDCSGDLQHGSCGGGAQIVRFDENFSALLSALLAIPKKKSHSNNL